MIYREPARPTYRKNPPMTIDFATLLKLLQPILAVALGQLAPGSTGAILIQLLIQIVSQQTTVPHAFGAARVALPPHPWTEESLTEWAASQDPGVQHHPV